MSESEPDYIITVWAVPRPKQSFRYGQHRGYRSAAVEEWESEVKAAALRMYPGEMLEEKIAVDIDFSLKRDADLDNLCKGTLDALQGIVFRNDRQIVELRARKLVTGEEHFARIAIWRKKENANV